jgi:hypothetical protein
MFIKLVNEDIAVLYEYWLFFKLYDLMVDKFMLNHIKQENNNELREYNHLIDVTKDGLQLIIKSGTYTTLDCVYQKDGWEFNVRFSYNKTFKASRNYSEKKEGSWTKPLRPDYTLSIWPKALSCNKAEEEEQIVHIHFDSKYKVQQFVIPEDVENKLSNSEIDAEVEDLDEDRESLDSLTIEKRNELRGVYKNADLMKMHAYKDAIRRTGGAYILYPGTEEQKPLRGFHEIIPGLGAFAIRPQKSKEGMDALSIFIDEIIENFKNSASQQKKASLMRYETYKDSPAKVEDPLPHNIIPDDTFVLVGYYNSPEQYEWIKKQNLYNFRMGSGNGSLILDKETVSAKYLLLHTKGDEKSDELWKIISKGPKVFTRQNLELKGYPKAKKLKDYQKNYLVIELEKLTEPEFENVSWDFKKFKNYEKGRASSFPYTTNLTELMKNKTKP